MAASTPASTNARKPRQSRASRGAAAAAADKPQLQAVPNPSETPKPQPQVTSALKPQPKPQPAVTVEAVPVTYYRPSVKFPDGRVIVCAHKYLHENEKAGQACGRKIAALGAFVK